MRVLLAVLTVAAATQVGWCSAAFAEAPADKPTVVEQLITPGPNSVSLIAVVLIFGTSLISSLAWGLSKIIGALRNDGGNSTAIRAEVVALEQRVAALEQALGTLAGTSEQAVQSR